MLVGNITVRDLAQATFVSTATVMRLCQKLGFSDYREFIGHCKKLLTDTLRNTPFSDAQESQTPAFFGRFIYNYRKTFQWVTLEKMMQCAQMLREKERFFLYIAGFSWLFIESLTKKLQVMGRTAFISGPGDSCHIFSATSPAIRPLLLFPRGDETPEVANKARIAKNIGMTVVAFTHASANILDGITNLHFTLYDEAIHYVVEATGITSFESNLVLLMDLLLLEAAGESRFRIYLLIWSLNRLDIEILKA